MKNNYLVQAWLVLTLALCFGAALAGVEAALGGKITENKLNETIGQIPSLVPGSTGGQKQQVDDKTIYRAVDADGKTVGWVIPASGQGFADKIEVIVGLDAEAGTITGMYVLDQKETPGLGDNIRKDDWRKQFAGKATVSSLEVVKSDASEGNQIAAVTGATISSNSVCDIVNTTVADFREKLAALVTE